MDERLEELENEVEEATPIKIDTIKLNNYRFFLGSSSSNPNNIIECNGNNVLIYGENGTGKSSIFTAFELLAKQNFKSLKNESNIFNEEESEATIEFSFSNGQELILHKDLEKIPEGMEYLNHLSLLFPMLNYKKLLRVHYVTNGNGKPINLFSLLEDLFKDFPLENGKKLSEINETDVYFRELQKILNEIILEYTNKLLKDFETNIQINKFIYKGELTEDRQKTINVINVDLDFMEKSIENFHHFLNEGRLTSLAISLYFSAIKTIQKKSNNSILKILVLDDILISLDMGNRERLNRILQNEFSDFQIFFFTHEKNLYDYLRDDKNILWEQIEMYVSQDNGNYLPKMKLGKSYFKRAKEYFDKNDSEVAANYLRKGLEKILKNFLRRNDKTPSNDTLYHLIKDSMELANKEQKEYLREMDKYRTTILNIGSHDSRKPIYSKEFDGLLKKVETWEKSF